MQDLQGMGQVHNEAAQSRPIDKQLADLIPEFNPKNNLQTVDMWLFKMDEYAAAYNWTERATISYALTKLRGSARV